MDGQGKSPKVVETLLLSGASEFPLVSEGVTLSLWGHLVNERRCIFADLLLRDWVGLICDIHGPLASPAACGRI
ncbi:MAG: hypothetical protein KBT72_07380 [Zhongshania sp.]|nr:hypothetical protein [Zhongshania sp.]